MSTYAQRREERLKKYADPAPAAAKPPVVGSGGYDPGSYLQRREARLQKYGDPKTSRATAQKQNTQTLSESDVRETLDQTKRRLEEVNRQLQEMDPVTAAMTTPMEDDGVPVLGPTVQSYTSRELQESGNKVKSLQQEKETLESRAKDLEEWYAAWETVQEDNALLEMDLEAEQESLEQLRQVENNYLQTQWELQKLNSGDVYWGVEEERQRLEERLAQLTSQYDIRDVGAMREERLKKENRFLRAKRLQTANQMPDPSDPMSESYDPRFEELSTYVPKQAQQMNGGELGTDYTDLAYEFINGNPNVSELTADLSKNYYYIEDRERKIYNYYYALEGRERAEQYLTDLQEELHRRSAKDKFDKLQGKVLLELAFAVGAGGDSFYSGIDRFFTSSDYTGPSESEILSGMVREDLADVTGPMWLNLRTGQWEDKVFGSSLGQMLYDGIYTTSNMVNSALAGSVLNMLAPGAGSVAGAGLMGMSSAGNAYQQMRAEGFDEAQSRAYGLLSGAAEASLSYLLGGIEEIGGAGLSYMTRNLDKVDNVLANVAKSAAGKKALSMASEGLEESLQSFLEPYVRQAVTGEEVTQDWEENLYSGLMGMLSAGAMGGGEADIPITAAEFDRQLSSLQLSPEEITVLQGWWDRQEQIQSLTGQIQQLQEKIDSKKNRGAGIAWLNSDQRKLKQLERLKGIYEQAQQKEEADPGFQRLQDHLIASENPEMSTNVDIENVDIQEKYAYIINDTAVITDGSHIENGKLKPNATYLCGEYDYLYQSNEYGFVENVYVLCLQMKKHEKRENHVRNTPGKRKGDHAGHLIADRFGGDRGLGNVVSQLAHVNLSEYKKLENIWAKAVSANQQVALHIHIENDEAGRPKFFDVVYQIDGGKVERKIINNNKKRRNDNV